MKDESLENGNVDVVEMHLSRTVGTVYCAITAVVLLLVLLGVGSYLAGGRLVLALVAAVVGLAVVAFLAVVTAAVVLPALTVDRTGVSGRTARGGRIVAGWEDITLDVDGDAAPGTIRMHVEGESWSLSGRSWYGFREFVFLVARTPAAAGRLTSSARAEVDRLPQITDRD